MAANILAACNLQQEPGAVSWYVPVVEDQSIQVKTCYLHSVHSFNSWKTAVLTICGLASQRSTEMVPIKE